MSPCTSAMRAELEAMAGKKVYKMMAAYLDSRLSPGLDGGAVTPSHGQADGRPLKRSEHCRRKSKGTHHRSTEPR